MTKAKGKANRKPAKHTKQSEAISSRNSKGHRASINLSLGLAEPIYVTHI